MAQSKIAAETRTEFGKGAARRTRKAGKIPAVLYGHGTDPQHLTLPSLEFAAVVREQGRNAVLELDISGTSQLALTKTVTFHPIRPYIEHVDLLVVKRGEKVVVEIPVIVTGEAAPGTLVTQDLNTVEVEADALNIPENVEISVEGVEVGTHFTAGSLTLPRGSELRTDAEALVVNVVAAPTAEDLEATEDLEGAGVVEVAPETPAAEPEAPVEAESGDGESGSAES
ncbi:50S ribosomal protein L25/general stress protein Ctc [Pseudonocardia sp. RS010]|uniref:50S ribosomal protein L25/general stress protein Ctc n=1 Tax=Pseudonocardia sp. RS010 TaxID=3385979 RepID=UPI00399F49BB